MPEVKPQIETFAKIKVLGIGGSGNSIVNRMVSTGVRGVEFWVLNTDVQALHNNNAENKIHIGKEVTRGLGAGMDPSVGKEAAKETEDEIREALEDTDMVFVTCGLGGGTGSGASPVVAEIAKDMGILTVGVVTKPFSWEGPQRMDIAKTANEELAEHVDTIITIPNDKILQVIEKDTSLVDAFEVVDDVLRQGVQGISELITVPGMVNVDFADVQTIMSNRGSALMGIASSEGKNRAIEAAQQAVSSPLLDLSIDGAQGILFSITGGKDLGMQEVSEAAQIITDSTGDNAQVIFGAVVDEDIQDEVRITVIATGFEGEGKSSEEGSQSTRQAKQKFQQNQSQTESSQSRSKVSANSKSQNKEKETTPIKNKKQNNKTQNQNKSNQRQVNNNPDFQKKSMNDKKHERKRTQQNKSDSSKKSKNKASSADRNQSNQREQVEEKQQKQMETQKEQKETNENNDDDDDLEVPAFIRKKMGM